MTMLSTQASNINWLVTGISDGSLLAVVADHRCDVGLVRYGMAVLVDETGAVLTPARRAELQAALPR